MKTPILHSSLVLTLNKLWQPLGFRTVREAFLRMTDQNCGGRNENGQNWPGGTRLEVG